MKAENFITDNEVVRQHLIRMIDSGAELEITVKPVTKNRTNKQNAAMHKYFELLADALNDAGLDMRKVLKEAVEIPWDAHNVKERLWRPIQVAMIRQQSTADQNTGEVSRVYEVLARHLSAKLGIYVPWPSRRSN